MRNGAICKRFTSLTCSGHIYTAQLCVCLSSYLPVCGFYLIEKPCFVSVFKVIGFVEILT